jgi:hypothetical protein
MPSILNHRLEDLKTDRLPGIHRSSEIRTV